MIEKSASNQHPLATAPIREQAPSPSTFKPAWWLPSPHLQTLWPTFFRSRPKLTLQHERLELDDGDFLDLAWCGPRQGEPVLVLHGLEGSAQSHYVPGLLKGISAQGMRACFVHFRGCSGEPNRLARSYHSGETGDLQRVSEHVAQRSGKPVHGAVGFSLGGNVLLKWLGELGARGEADRVQRAVAVSVPFNLNDAALRLQHGASRLYQWHLIGRLKDKFKTKFNDLPCPLDVDLQSLRSFRQFDDQITAPLHGFSGVDDYYTRSSSQAYLRDIGTPTLLLHSKDDPFMFESTAPAASDLSDQVHLDLTERGGHVGFVAGVIPGRAHYWAEQRILEWLQKT